MNDQTRTSEIIVVPIEECYLHAINPRQDVPEGDVAAMADSIEINGLLQNLCAYQDPEQKGFGIVAGGRRLRGLWYLKREGRLTSDLVPIAVTSDPQTARSWSLAEGATQRELHPADEVLAYREMRAQGSSPSHIAKAFARSEQFVQRRLKLADLPREAIDALRADQINISQAQALTLADNQDKASELLEAVLHQDMNAIETWLPEQMEDG